MSVKKKNVMMKMSDRREMFQVPPKTPKITPGCVSGGHTCSICACGTEGMCP